MGNSIVYSITVVIPSYNEDRYIYNTLWFLSRQIFAGKLNVIIADAGSTDLTLERISKAKEDFKNLNIKVIKGGSVSVGRNAGASMVTTPYILFLDADSILFDSDILTEVNKISEQYDLISCKQKSTVIGLLPWLTWKVFDLVRKIMPESFSTGCFFFISKDKFNELGGFDESLNNSEDFWLSRNIPKSKFKILNRYIGQDDRRFKKMGYISFFKILLLNYWHRNNIDWFKKDVGYWKPYK